ncbi:sensor histidine kinase [Deinococcus radiophilus]|uniref:sensor histidine kinase n=1 Tax=Deinococcus radiophilus TaxID=32062 RepID=UPI0036190B40
MRDQLVHMLVHDLKNPITAILGLLEVVADDPRLPDDAKDLLEVARDETSHLLHLSLNMLDVRKIQAGKMHLKREQMTAAQLEQTVQQAMGDVGAGLSDRQLTVNIVPMPPLSADPTMLRRVLANLLSNALKHTTQRPDRGTNGGYGAGVAAAGFRQRRGHPRRRHPQIIRGL